MLITGDDLMTRFESEHSSPWRFGQCFKSFVMTYFQTGFFKLRDCMFRKYLSLINYRKTISGIVLFSSIFMVLLPTKNCLNFECPKAPITTSPISFAFL